MAKVYVYGVTARPGNAFPLDMLRYDRAWPRDQHSVNMLHLAYGADTDEPPTNQGGAVEVQVASNQQPTVARWRTFGWQVGKVTTR